MSYQWMNTNESVMTWQSAVASSAGAGVSDVARGRLLGRCSKFHLPLAFAVRRCTHLAVFLVLAPHLFAEASGRLAGSVWRDDVVVDQS